jgi:hypothetical protein
MIKIVGFVLLSLVVGYLLYSGYYGYITGLNPAMLRFFVILIGLVVTAN